MTSEHPILRRHRLITQGSPTPEQASTIVETMAANLQALAKNAPSRRPSHLHITGREALHQMLSKAAHTSKPFTRQA